eukprot:1162095-Pelagomonas_calceolata.AAC.5
MVSGWSCGPSGMTSEQGHSIFLAKAKRKGEEAKKKLEDTQKTLHPSSSSSNREILQVQFTRKPWVMEQKGWPEVQLAPTHRNRRGRGRKC